MTSIIVRVGRLKEEPLQPIRHWPTTFQLKKKEEKGKKKQTQTKKENYKFES